MKKYDFITKELVEREYINNNRSPQQIADEFRCSDTVIYKKLLKYSIPRRNLSEAVKESIKQRGFSHRYKDGRCSKKYYCIDCGTEITLFSGFYGSGRCGTCCKRGTKNNMFGKHCSIIRYDFYKSGYYKGIYMRSSYEIKFAQFLDSSGYKYQYESKTFDLGNSTYTPDFYIPEWNSYIELKGYWHSKAKRKFNLFMKQYPKIKIKVLMKPELQKFGII